MILLIGYEKGGTGKSTLAKNLSVYLQQKGRDLIAVDTDPQQTLYRWSEARNNNPDVQSITCVKLTGSKILADLKSLAGKYQDVVIDAGGVDSPALRASLAVATHLLVPMQPNMGDIEILDHMTDLIEQAKMYNPDLYCRAVITMCPTLPSQAGLILDAKEVCASYELPALNAITCKRLVYDQIGANGLSVLESDNQKARQEIIEIATEFLGV
jgi:chromosome partitioning protein